MARYPLQNYYVGRLNICHDLGQVHDPKKDKIKKTCISHGAIDCNWASLCDRRVYDSVFTLFYREGYDKYYCLHNGETYTPSGEVFVSDLVPFLKCSPSVGSIFDNIDALSPYEVKVFFEAMFNHKSTNLYNHDKYPADNFYFGDYKLYIGKTGEMQTPNLAQRLLLSAYNLEPYKSETMDDGSQYEYYKVIALWVNVYRMYNINDHRQSGEYISSQDGTELITTDQLIDDEYFKDRTWSDRVTIQHMLRLQRGFNKKGGR